VRHGGKIAVGIASILALTGAVSFYGSDRAPLIPPVTKPARVAAALTLRGTLELPNGYVLYTVDVDSFPLPYQCLVLATPQQGTLRCDADAGPAHRKLGGQP
jgi:hypothetical protein